MSAVSIDSNHMMSIERPQGFRHGETRRRRRGVLAPLSAVLPVNGWALLHSDWLRFRIDADLFNRKVLLSREIWVPRNFAVS